MEFEFTPLIIAQIITSFLMVFFLGVQIDVSDNVRRKARIAWFLTIIILWIIIFIR